MGAIVAILGEAGDPELAGRLQRMLARSPYRGDPEFLVEGPIAIGIQSMGWDASLHSVGNWLTAFHGYIGNWVELASAHGWAFPEDASNAHKIAIAYETLGDALFAKLRGEWVTVIVDRHHGELLVARDVVGSRPLFQGQAAGRLFLSSEIRQIFAGSNRDSKPSPEGIIAHLVRYPLTDGRTVFKDVTQVLPARIHRYFLAQQENTPRTAVYWQPPPEERIARRHILRLADELHHLLEWAVRRTLPDLPFACTLSGGMDSGSIWGLIVDLAERGEPKANNGRPVSLVYPGMEYDETSLIRTHRWHSVVDPIFIDASEDYSLNHLNEMTRAVDFIHHPTLFQVGVVDAVARADGRRVVLDGIGGDEWFFGGYNYLFDLWRHGRLITCLLDCRRLSSPRRWGFQKAARALLPPSFSARKMSSEPPPPPSWLHSSRHELYLKLQRQPRFPDLAEGSACRQELIDSLTFKQSRDGLLSVEQLSARDGVECRRPLMDLDLIEFAFRSDGQMFVAGKGNKHLMRLAMQDVLPQEVLTSTAVYHASEVVARGLSAYARQHMDQEWLLVEENILDEDDFRRTLEMAISGNIDGEVHLFSVFSTELFLLKHTRGRSLGVS